MSKYTTGFVWHDLYAWHDTGTYAAFMRPGLTVQPHQHIEHPDSKRRFAELISVSGMNDHLVNIRPELATREDLLRFHTPEYVDKIRTLSEGRGGEAGEHTPFGPGGYEIACLSTGGCISLLESVYRGDVRNGYSLNRPPGHHAVADQGRGFCIFGNGVVAIRRLQAMTGVKRVAVVDWDVHHGNSAQDAFYQDPSVLTISVHQDRNYPTDSGALSERGIGAGWGTNINIPLPAGSGDEAYMNVFDMVIVPALTAYKPSVIIVHSGFDASVMDPLGRMLLNSESYRKMTRKLMDAADTLCDGRLAMFHEGGYSPTHVPYCGLAVLEELSGTKTGVRDPFLDFCLAQAGHSVLPHQQAVINEAAAFVSEIPVEEGAFS
ncbi:class II histone deacetylase (plasmid) [Burkholderia vietnamiensis]|uniref:Histone deacetylase superfamily n=1 Tax=Burkholderia vietnamiensis (strain G4 / LMG 22486) TaxID=269482 RepID=A4JTS4_BURVG|nr:histone deacetylase superfamily [Burkholderia vietnamiensis G4]MCB4350165.1 class II histone deacetylase [Burkholderia vietnamiensis]